ncbi:MAG: hypothetical protein ABIP55_06195, partial [Tepidisphaeraceae bacterium]
MAALVLFHVEGVNGPWYWRWAWRRLGWETYPILLAASAPFFTGHWLYARGKISVRWAIALVMLAALCLQVGAVIPQPLGLGRIPAVVQNSVNTSYYNVAEVLYEEMNLQGKSLRDWMEIYPQLMSVLMLHASFKPPGWILYYLGLMQVFGGPGAAAAWAGGLLVAVVATTAVPMTYRLARLFDIDELSAFCAASFFALTPSLLLFVPQHDQTYPALACLMILTWCAALRRGPRWTAAAFGGLLALSLFLSAVFLMLGLFLSVYTLLYVGDRGCRGAFQVLVRGTVTVLAVVGFYLMLYLATGFDPVETFFTSARRSQAHIVELQRPWPMHSLLDLADIALGIGWIAVPLIAWGAAFVWRTWNWRQPQFRLVFLGLMQVAMAVAVAVFPGENARLMLPIMPLLMAPIG